MTLPRVTVIGSCVSRDPFSRRFFPAYKSRVQLVSCVYQTSLPSAVRSARVRASSLPESVRSHNTPHIREELAGQAIKRVLEARPDIVVVDFYADTHLGLTVLDGQFVTRNHLAFQTSVDADNFYRDEHHDPSRRGRFEDGAGLRGGYRGVVKEAIETLLTQVDEHAPGALLVLNSARFSMSYVDEREMVVPFPNERRLAEKNLSWARLDGMFGEITGCARLAYPESVFVGSASHAWGLNPVHYEQSYYDHFWRVFADATGV